MIIFPALDTWIWNTGPHTSYSHRTALWHFPAVGLTGCFKYIGPAILQERKANWICRVYWQFSRALLVAGIRVSFITFRTSVPHRVWGLVLWKYRLCPKTDKLRGLSASQPLLDVICLMAVKCDMSQVMKVQLSFYLVLLSFDSKTRQRDSHTFEP